MKAVKATGKINMVGQLSLDYPIKGTLPSSVRVIIVWEETETEVNDFWQQISEYQQHPLRSAEQLQQELKQSLTEAGYDSREKIVDLVQDIKREISQERQQKHNEILRCAQNDNHKETALKLSIYNSIASVILSIASSKESP